MKKYALRYEFVPENRKEGYTKDDATEGKGLCDALLGVSIIFANGGGYSQAIFGFNGKENRSLNHDDFYQVWEMMGLMLYDENQLKGYKQEMVKNFSTIIRSMYKIAREQETEK